MLPRGHCRCSSALPEEVECELGLGDELISEKVREQVGNFCKDC